MRLLACGKCGKIFEGKTSQDACPACEKPRSALAGQSAARIDASLVNSLAPSEPAKRDDDAVEIPPEEIQSFVAQGATVSPDEARRFAGAPVVIVQMPAPATGPAPMQADERNCPRCAERIKLQAKVCRFCGCEFESPAPSRETGRRASSARIAVRREIASEVREQWRPTVSPGVAAALSFVIPGLGQIVLGYVGRGLVFFFSWPFFMVPTFLLGGVFPLIGLVGAVLMWTLGIIDAHACAYGDPHGANPMDSTDWRRRWRGR